jgi:hypothetical protein
MILNNSSFSTYIIFTTWFVLQIDKRFAFLRFASIL